MTINRRLMRVEYTEPFVVRVRQAGDGMSGVQLHYRVRPSVYAFVKLCTRLLDHTEHVPLTEQEREIILLNTRKLVERFL